MRYKLILFFTFFLGALGYSSTSAVQTISFVIAGGNDSISLTGDVTKLLFIKKGETIIDDSTYYGYTTGSFGSTRQITAYLQNELPDGVELSVALDPPPSGPISTTQTLTQASAVVLYNIPVNSMMLTGTYRIVYKLRAHNHASSGMNSAVIIYTISEG